MKAGPESRKRVRLLTALVVVALCTLALAGPVLAIPSTWEPYGTIRCNGVPAPDGLHLTTWINNVQYGSGATVYTESGIPGYFFLSVPGDDADTVGVIEGGVANDVVVFKLTGTNGLVYQALETALWQPLGAPELALTFAPLPPLAVDVTSFSANVNWFKVTVRWQTANESDLLGFNLYRGADVRAVSQGSAVKLNVRLIPSRSTTPGQGAQYTYTDPFVRPGVTNYYWVEEVKTSGAGQVFGPVTATQGGGEMCGDKGICPIIPGLPGE